MSKIGRIIINHLEKMTKMQFVLLFVLFAVFFSQILVWLQYLIFRGKPDYFTMLVGFITPFIDAFFIIYLFLLVLNRSKVIKSLVDHSNDEIFILNMDDGRISYANNSAVERLGYSSAEIEQLTFADINQLSGKFDHWDKIAEGVRNDGRLILEGKNLTKSEECYPVEVSLSTDTRSQQDNIIAVVRDISQRKQFEKELENLASTDVLTGIFNRRKLMKVLSLEVKRATRYNQPLCLIMFDLDHFKSVNDNYGHDVGDFVLREVSRMVSKRLRETNFFARFGGEEFIVILPVTELAGAGLLAERLRLTIEQLDTTPVNRVTASLGVVQLMDNEATDELLKRVDVALYAAKDAGRNQVVMHEHDVVCG